MRALSFKAQPARSGLPLRREPNSPITTNSRFSGGGSITPTGRSMMRSMSMAPSCRARCMRRVCAAPTVMIRTAAPLLPKAMRSVPNAIAPAGNANFQTLKRAAYDVPSHHHHEVGSEGARCVSCHMPAKKFMRVDPRRDHSFRVPSPGPFGKARDAQCMRWLSR